MLAKRHKPGYRLRLKVDTRIIIDTSEDAQQLRSYDWIAPNKRYGGGFIHRCFPRTASSETV